MILIGWGVLVTDRQTNKSGDDHEENVLWKSKTAEEWYKFPKVQDDL